MSSEPQTVRLGDVCRIKQGRYVAPSEMKESASESHAVPVVGGNGVLGFVDRGTHDFGVALVTCRGSRCGLMQWAEPPTWVSNNAMAVYFENDHGDNYFLYHYLRTQNFDDVTTGTAQPQITVSSLSQKTVLLPSSPTQKAIGRLMRLFEKKIQSNRRTAELLEGLASSFFRSWFIDFDPVKAKMAGEAPVGMDSETAALFPDSMEESELGAIPSGWEVDRLESVIELLDSKRVPLNSSERKNRPGPYPYFGATGVLDFIDASLFEGPHVLVGEDGSVVTTDGKPVVQYVWGEFWVSNHAHVLKGKRGFSVEHVKLLLETIDIGNYITGAVQLKLSQQNLKSVPIVVPPQETALAFGKLLNPFFSLFRSLADQSTTLAKLRDSLLPRLVSGELEIPEEMLAASR